VGIDIERPATIILQQLKVANQVYDKKKNEKKAG
jgi:hypothetical protein